MSDTVNVATVANVVDDNHLVRAKNFIEDTIVPFTEFVQPGEITGQGPPMRFFHVVGHH